jgi:hypothetical protein
MPMGLRGVVPMSMAEAAWYGPSSPLRLWPAGRYRRPGSGSMSRSRSGCGPVPRARIRRKAEVDGERQRHPGQGGEFGAKAQEQRQRRTRGGDVMFSFWLGSVRTMRRRRTCTWSQLEHGWMHNVVRTD